MADNKTEEVVKKVIDDSKKQKRKFKQNIDLVVNLKNIDMKESKNRIDEDVLLPHGRGKEAKIALFASGELALKAKKSVDLLIKPEEIEDYSKDKKQFKKIADAHDFFVAEAPLMPTIGKTLGVGLGPKGKMPRPDPPTVDIDSMTKNLRNTIKLRSKANLTFHTVVGKEDMSTTQIAENIDLVIKRLEAKLERGRMNIGSIYIKTTMGPSERII